jgi:acyl-CoA reductase-like NAD-dependent aldehyde dehydrogenase
VTCDRFYVHESCYAAFVDGFAARASRLKVGYGLEPDTQMGPLIHPRRLEMASIVEDARRERPGGDRWTAYRVQWRLFLRTDGDCRPAG